MFLHFTTTTTNTHKSRPARSLSLRLPTTRRDAAAVAAPPPIDKLKRGRRWRSKNLRNRPLVVLLALCSFAFTYLVLTQHHESSEAPEEKESARLRISPLPVDSGIDAISHWEEDLPGNAVSHRDMEDERYLRYLNENWGVGFNNQLQEIILHAHLAYLSNRTFVLPPLNFPNSDHWHPLSAFVRGALASSPSPHLPSSHASKLQLPFMSRTPKPSNKHDREEETRPTAPLRAVTRNHFYRSCPNWNSARPANYTALEQQYSPLALPPPNSTSHLQTSHHQHQQHHSHKSQTAPQYASVSAASVNTLLGLEEEPAGDKLLDGWSKLLSGMTERCVVVESSSAHVFDFKLFGSPRILSILPSLLRSPVLQDLHWSDLVHGAVERNLRSWGWISDPAKTHDSAGDRDWVRREDQDYARVIAPGPADEPPNTHAPLPRLLALHLRRGDYKEHCEYLSVWASGYLGVNELEGLGDRFTVPDHGNITPAQRAAFARHCWPELPDILQRVRTVRQEWQARVVAEESARARWWRWAGRGDGGAWRLNRIYVLTNGDGVWWEGVKRALEAEGWGDVRGSGDMDFGRDGERDGRRRESERLVGQAVDMEMAARAEVFVGNGFSSLTSNVNLLRLAHGAPGASIRFW